MGCLRKVLAEGAVIVLFVGAAFQVPADAQSTVPPTDAKVAAPHSSPARFGFIAPTATRALMQPIQDRFANELLAQVAADASITIVPLPTLDGVSAATLNVCRELGLAGFVAPYRRWNITSDLVTVEGDLRVSDCSGQIFFEGAVSHALKRDPTAIPQTQLDTAQAFAMAELVHEFSVERHTHAKVWSALTRSGALEQAESAGDDPPRR